jgi:hypothetical protein
LSRIEEEGLGIFAKWIVSSMRCCGCSKGCRLCRCTGCWLYPRVLHSYLLLCHSSQTINDATTKLLHNNQSLDNFLASKDLLSNTQALLYLSVTAKGVDPVDGITTVNPEGLTAATGVHAQAFADRLATLGLKCNVVSAEDYRPAMFEKLM